MTDYEKSLYDYYETDSLIEMIINAGLPLPIYNYEHRKFLTAFVENVRIDEKNVSLFIDDMHDTFKEACKSTLITFNINTPPKK